MLLGRKLFALTTAARLWWSAERAESSACYSSEGDEGGCVEGDERVTTRFWEGDDPDLSKDASEGFVGPVTDYYAYYPYGYEW